MYRRLKKLVYSTIMVVVFFAQQLFGAYHIFNFHSDEGILEIGDGQTLISDLEGHCDVCAKLNGPTVTLHLDQNFSIPFIHFPFASHAEETITTSTKIKSAFERGPPSFDKQLAT